MKLKLNTDWSWSLSSDHTSLARWVTALLPPHRALVEACGGAAFMSRPVSNVEVYNDLHGEVHNFFRVLRDAQGRQGVLELIESRTAPLGSLAPTPSDDPIVAAYNFYRASRRWWVPDLSSRWLNRGHNSRPFSDAAKLFNPIVDRFDIAQIEDLPADNVISRYDTPQTVHVVDLSQVTPGAITSILAALSSIRGKAVVLGSTPPERNLLSEWRTVVQPMVETPCTALVNFSPRRRAA